MREDLAGLLDRIAPVRPWAAFSALLMVALIGYYGYLGLRYWMAQSQVTALEDQVSAIPPKREALYRGLESELNTHEQRFEELQRVFDHSDSDSLLAVAAAAGRETGLRVDSMSIGKLRTEVDGDLRYEMLPMTIGVQGDQERIYRFLAVLSSRIPVKVTEIRIGGLESAPYARVELLSYIAAEAISDESKKNPQSG